jgi:acyl-coenzyme A thioesterase PaaI-like protein
LNEPDPTGETTPVDGQAPAPADGPWPSEARALAAASLRRLGSAIIDHEIDDALLTEITAAVQDLLPRIEAGAERVHTLLARGTDAFGTGPQSGDIEPASNTTFSDSIVSGRTNPMGMGAELVLRQEEALLTVTLGSAFEGAPGRAHGGMVAALIDEAMGFALSASGITAFTGRLTLTYRAPTPVGVPLEGHARVAHRQGRKLTITAELRCGETLLAEAEGLFIVVEAAHFLGQEPERNT